MHHHSDEPLPLIGAGICGPTIEPGIAAQAPSDDPLVKALAMAADQYLVKRSDRWTIMAGYPWFTDWGRDTMISLPGLTLFTGNASCYNIRMVENGLLTSGESGAQLTWMDAKIGDC